ncbi:MAG: zinc-ribbon domain-containing protein [Firmicutes bacterium]|nr:zinc-ribbon domain-containing protein [Bacillota bacterium]
MICKNCGAALPPGTKFCVECGARVVEDPVQPVRETVRQGSWSQYMNQPNASAPDTQMPTRDMPDSMQGTEQPQYSQPFYIPPYSQPSSPETSQPARSQQAAQPRTSYQATEYQANESQPNVPQSQEIVIRSHSTGGANALLISLSVLVFAVLLFIYLTVMPGSSSGGKNGSSGSAATPAGQQSSPKTDTAESAATATPAAIAEDFDFNSVPAEIQALIKTGPVPEDYYGKYTGSITYQFFGGDFLKSMGMPADQLAYYEEISGKTYSVTAEYADEDLIGYCTELPVANEDNRIFRFWIYGDLEDGIYEEDDIDAEDAFSFQVAERVYFLNDGSLYVVSGIVASQDGEPRGGAVYRSRLMPEG